jgi:NAD+ kinase
MRISIYGKAFNPEFHPFLEKLFVRLNKENINVSIYKPFNDFIKLETKCITESFSLFNSYDDLPDDTNFMVSIGGDGTFLETITFVKDKKIPIVGLNSGRLGFLANIAKEDIDSAFDAILENRFTYEFRTLIELKSPTKIFSDYNFALNEVTIQKKDSKMIVVHAYLDNEFLNSYWTDGLIVSTPTGSTAYSLSVGGPIVIPASNNFIIAPIAPHNLTVRPIIIPDNMELKLKVDGRLDKYLLTLDNRTKEVEKLTEVVLKKSKFQIKMLQLHNNNFYNTLRNKLMWGLDKRN